MEHSTNFNWDYFEIFRPKGGWLVKLIRQPRGHSSGAHHEERKEEDHIFTNRNEMLQFIDKITSDGW